MFRPKRVWLPRSVLVDVEPHLLAQCQHLATQDVLAEMLRNRMPGFWFGGMDAYVQTIAEVVRHPVPLLQVVRI